MQYHSRINSKPIFSDRLRAACKDIDVRFDKIEKKIVIRYRYYDRGGYDKIGTIRASYFRRKQYHEFEDHTHINQRDALEIFLKLSHM